MKAAPWERMAFACWRNVFHLGRYSPSLWRDTETNIHYFGFWWSVNDYFRRCRFEGAGGRTRSFGADRFIPSFAISELTSPPINTAKAVR